MRNRFRHVLHVIDHEVVSGEGLTQFVPDEGLRGRLTKARCDQGRGEDNQQQNARGKGLKHDANVVKLAGCIPVLTVL